MTVFHENFTFKGGRRVAVKGHSLVIGRDCVWKQVVMSGDGSVVHIMTFEMVTGPATLPEVPVLLPFTGAFVS
jgi:hypothetical protein